MSWNNPDKVCFLSCVKCHMINATAIEWSRLEKKKLLSNKSEYIVPQVILIYCCDRSYLVSIYSFSQSGKSGSNILKYSFIFVFKLS